MTNDHYLSTQFSRRPLLDADAIIETRCELLGLRPPVEDGPEVVERWDIMAAVEDLHTSFWSMDAAAFEDTAKAINTTSYPTYADEIERLLEINACRDDFDQLAVMCETADEERFAAMLRRIAVANRHAGIVIREQLVYTLSVGDAAIKTLPGEWHTDADPERQLAIADSCQIMAARVQDKFPRLYQMNPDWFERIIATSDETADAS